MSGRATSLDTSSRARARASIDRERESAEAATQHRTPHMHAPVPFYMRFKVHFAVNGNRSTHRGARSTACSFFAYNKMRSAIKSLTRRGRGAGCRRRRKTITLSISVTRNMHLSRASQRKPPTGGEAAHEFEINKFI